MASDLTKIGAFWLRDAKNGSKYMSGKIEQALPADAVLLVFKNNYKKEDKHPDYEIFVKQVEQTENTVSSSTAPPQGPSAAQTRKAMAAAPDEDIPF